MGTLCTISNIRFNPLHSPLPSPLTKDQWSILTMTSVEITDQAGADLPKGRVICLLWEREIGALEKGGKDR